MTSDDRPDLDPRDASTGDTEAGPDEEADATGPETDTAEPESTDATAARRKRRRRVDDAPLVPGRSSDDSDVGWGRGDDSNDQRLREDVPPHW